MSISEYIKSLSALQALGLLLLAYLAYGACLALYRISFHPLAKYPGPKIAAATLWYEFYFDVVKKGNFAFEINRLHKVYGPIVRINPFELHIDDPDFYDEIYTGATRKRDKHPWSADLFAIPGSMISSVPHELHRRRRQPIAPFFSFRAIRRFEPIIRDKIELLCSKLQEYEASAEPVNLEDAYSALTADVITRYAFGAAQGQLGMPGFNGNFTRGMASGAQHSPLHKQYPWVTTLFRSVPLPLLLKIQPPIAALIGLKAFIKDRVDGVRVNASKSGAEEDNLNIFHKLLTSDLPASDLTDERLVGEAQNIMAAGTTTTAHYLMTTTFHILANPLVVANLKAELQDAIPDASTLPDFYNLDRLPYLNAVINEGLRISVGIVGRLTRVAPEEDLCFHEWLIPAGTAVSMSAWDSHRNPRIFPEPYSFDPERWLGLEPAQLSQKKKYLVNFTKGARQCLGKDLARTEIVLTLSAMFRRFDFELFETDRSDVDIEHDFFIPMPRLDSKGARALVKKRGAFRSWKTD